MPIDTICHFFRGQNRFELTGGKDRFASRWPRVCDFLRLEPLDVRSGLKRQRELSQDEAILNYEEVKAHCAGTFAEPYFDA